MCGEQMLEDAQDRVTDESVDSPSREPASTKTDVTVPFKDSKPASEPAAVVLAGGLSSTGQSEVPSEDSEDLQDVADAALEELSEVPVGDSALIGEPGAQADATREPSAESELDIEVVQDEVESPAPGGDPQADAFEDEPSVVLEPASSFDEVQVLGSQGEAAGDHGSGGTLEADEEVRLEEVRLEESTSQAEGEETAAPEQVEPSERAPLAAGTVVGERWQIVGALDEEDGEILYLAHDLLGCWQCGFQENEPDDAFCGQCGASLDHRPQVRLLEVQSEDAKPSDGAAIDARVSHKGRHLILLAEPLAAPEADAELGVPDGSQRIRLVVGFDSDAGQVRELDEDSLLALTLAPTYESRTGPVMGLFSVADGMGGHEGGELASRMALQVLAEAVLRSIVLPELADEDLPEEEVVARLRQATVNANEAVYLARQKRGNDMGTTLTTALVRDDRLFLAHVGDCRAYRWSADGLQQLTTDHSLVASMVASGQAAPEEVYTHPHRSVIYRCVGDQPVVEVDTDVLPLASGDRLIVCCDGLWEMVRDEGIEDVMMQEADPQAASELLVQHANVAGGDDNISIIIVQVEGV
jgi:serine/threonine protein phosphatase PrpC